MATVAGEENEIGEGHSSCAHGTELRSWATCGGAAVLLCAPASNEAMASLRQDRAQSSIDVDDAVGDDAGGDDVVGDDAVGDDAVADAVADADADEIEGIEDDVGLSALCGQAQPTHKDEDGVAGAREIFERCANLASVLRSETERLRACKMQHTEAVCGRHTDATQVCNQAIAQMDATMRRVSEILTLVAYGCPLVLIQGQLNRICEEYDASVTTPHTTITTIERDEEQILGAAPPPPPRQRVPLWWAPRRVL
jgi:hypothetical protein